MKNKLGITVVIIICLGTIFLLFSRHQSEVESNEVLEDAKIETSQSVKFSIPTIDSVEIDEETNYYTIEGLYPETSYELVQDYVNKTISEFKQIAYEDLGEISNKENSLLGWDEYRKYSLNLRYDMYVEGQTQSIVMYENTYTLGAHSNTIVKSFVFDLANKKPIELAQLFASDNHLDIISNLAKKELPNIIGPEADLAWIAEGASPLAENFSNFYLDKGNLYIIFSPYQVAPYSAGIISVSIPLQKLRDLLKLEQE